MTKEPQEETGVLLTAVGGPNSLDEVKPFLIDIRGGRPTPEELVAEFRERYAKIGGKSPLLEISRAQAAALEARLREGGDRFPCYVGMRNWTPYIRDVYAQMVSDGLRRIIVLPLTPYHSRRSVGAYFRAVEDAHAHTPVSVDLRYIESWNTEPALVDAFAQRVRRGLERLAADGHRDPVVLFTAHSLPTKLMEDGDDYEKELQETMSRILKQVPPVRSGMAWQSAGRTAEPWLGPALEQVLEELGQVGEQAVLVVPFGFVSDHLEILYDVDVEAREQAQRLGMRLERTESLNTDPTFIEAMAAVVRSAVASA